MQVFIAFFNFLRTRGRAPVLRSIRARTQVQKRVVKSGVSTPLLTIVLVLLASSVDAQQSYRNWYFGDSCHVQFDANGQNPIVVDTGNRPQFARTGTTSVSDDQGTLLFYSNGREVRDGNMNLVRDDLRGPGDAGMNAVPTPVPGQPGSYFLFTASRNIPGDFVNHDTVFYSLVTTNGGVTASDPVFFADSVNHKVLVISHENGEDYWVIAPKGGDPNGPAYYTSLITAGGVGPVTVQYFDHPFLVDGSEGYLRASPNGRLLATARNNSRFDLLSFDPATGEIGWLKSPFLGNYRFDGVEFSPDGCDIYLIGSGGSFSPFVDVPGRIFRYRVGLNEIEEHIIPGIFPVDFLPEISSQQRGPDGWIYFSNQLGNAVGRFDPSAADPFATVDADFLQFGPGMGQVQQGLPHPLPRLLDQGSGLGCEVNCEPVACNQTSVQLVPTGEECCYRLLVDNEFAADPELLQSLTIGPVGGQSIGYSAIDLLPQPPGWLVTTLPGSRFFAVGTADTLPQGNDVELLTFCVEDAPATEPVRLVAEWASVDGVLCTDTVSATCFGCLEIVGDSLVCGADAMTYGFSFVNNSPYPVNTVRLLPPESESADVLLSEETITLSEEVPVGGTYSGRIPISFIDTDGDGVFCFDIILRRVLPSLNVAINCCYATHCITPDNTDLIGGSSPLGGAVSINPAGELKCDPAIVELSATVTGLPAGAADLITWSGPDNTSLLPPLIGASALAIDTGLFRATYRDVFGCTVQDSVRVIADREPPVAVIPDTLDITCIDELQLDASMSLPTGLTFAWNARETGTILSGGNGEMPFIDGPGIYELTVINPENGCRDTAQTVVITGELTPAVLPEDITDCSVPQTITGNLPPGTTGNWEGVGDELAEWAATGATATVTTLGNGFSLIWTLSTADCPDYSSDTIAFTGGIQLSAADDTLSQFDEEGMGTINLLDNDVAEGPVTIRLLNTPEFGTFDLDSDGLFTLRIDPCLMEETSVDYEISSVECGAAIATATLFIRSTVGNMETAYNAISPNGDGMNDLFVFDEIERCPEMFPQREIVIYNRWGDILFEASPYLNDWDGTNKNGRPVPEGTYYYVLRLNVGEGDVLRGNVTVIR